MWYGKRVAGISHIEKKMLRGLFMSGKLCVGLVLILGFFFSSCSPGGGPAGTDWPGENDIATMISITLTHLADVQLQSTPQPADQGLGNQGSQDLGSGVAQEAENQVAESAEEWDLPQDSPENARDGQAQGSSQGDSGEERSVVPAGIPGFNAKELVVRLAEFGFECPESQDQVAPLQWECVFETEDFRFEISIWGSSIDEIDLVEATAFYFGDLDYTGLTAVIFERVAEMSYENAQPGEAKGWVSVNLAQVLQIGDEAVTDFGGVRYSLYALPSMQVLEIGQQTE
jgi:hypothetical protein